MTNDFFYEEVKERTETEKREATSVDAFAKPQAEYREAGERSAAEYWKARGVAYP